LTGEELKKLPSTLTTWKKWKKRHPKTLVLSQDTGHVRDYTTDPYESYYRSPFTFFGFRGKTPELPEKELVLGVEIGEEKKAYPLSVIRKIKTPFEDTVSGKAIMIHFDSETQEAFATDREENRLPSAVLTYWYVWYAFNPETEIFKEE
jgi:hypothetical protein